MKVPPADTKLHANAKAEEVCYQYVRKLHRLLANLYLHVCPLPEPKGFVQTICT